MKKIISAVLCACTLLTLASCAGEDANVEITTAGDLTTTESQTTAEIDLGLTPVGENASPIILPGVQTEHEGFYKVKSPLTWEKISSFPIKSNDMTVDERRQLCVDFFRFTKNVKWVPDESFSFSKKQGTTPDTMQSGSLYGGLPYVSYGSGNVYTENQVISETTFVGHSLGSVVHPCKDAPGRPGGQSGNPSWLHLRITWGAFETRGCRIGPQLRTIKSDSLGEEPGRWQLSFQILPR